MNYMNIFEKRLIYPIVLTKETASRGYRIDFAPNSINVCFLVTWRRYLPHDTKTSPVNNHPPDSTHLDPSETWTSITISMASEAIEAKFHQQAPSQESGPHPASSPIELMQAAAPQILPWVKK
jgi:hypothetical protein